MSTPINVQIIRGFPVPDDFAEKKEMDVEDWLDDLRVDKQGKKFPGLKHIQHLSAGGDSNCRWFIGFICVEQEDVMRSSAPGKAFALGDLSETSTSWSAGDPGLDAKMNALCYVAGLLDQTPNQGYFLLGGAF